ncbi:MAG TPA: hypothetical protein VNR18_13435 [Hyphomicrobiales bacterium]|nr:hypothetical protein [Hyphomicrobiales bacterium]
MTKKAASQTNNGPTDAAETQPADTTIAPTDAAETTASQNDEDETAPPPPPAGVQRFRFLQSVEDQVDGVRTVYDPDAPPCVLSIAQQKLFTGLIAPVDDD